MRTKLHQLKTNSPIFSHDILFLTETWLNADISSSELGLHHYTTYRSDRNSITSKKSNGGGVMLCVSKNISSTKLPVKHKSVEQIFVLLNIPNRKIIIGCVYIPPASDLQTYKNHNEDIEVLKFKYPKAKFIIAGDYNLPNWTSQGDNGPATNQAELQCAKCSEIRDMSLFLGLTQSNKVFNINNRMLDLVFSSDSKIVVELSDELLLPLDQHHPPLDIIITNMPLTSSKKISAPSYNFSKAEYHHITEYLTQTDWSFLDEENNINDQLEYFYSILNTSIEQFVPRVSFTSSNYPKWFTRELTNLINKKNVSTENTNIPEILTII